jgi:hypothetical protein
MKKEILNILDQVDINISWNLTYFTVILKAFCEQKINSTYVTGRGKGKKNIAGKSINEGNSFHHDWYQEPWYFFEMLNFFKISI